MNSAQIKVKHIVLGTHNWPDVDKFFPEVGFLQYEHHHDFHIYVECNVTHDDREIEFIVLRLELMKIIDNTYPGQYIKKFGSSSCEMIGQVILEQLEKKYRKQKFFKKVKRNWKVSVFEDNIQGGIVNEN